MNTNKLSRSHLIVNSTERTPLPNSTSSSFSIDVGQAKYVNQAVIKSFSMNKKGLYNIHSKNNTFVYEVSGVEYTATVPIGYYSDFSLRSALQTALQVVHPFYTVTENTTTGKLSISSALFYPSRFSSDIVKSPLSHLLGFSNRTEEPNTWFPTVATTSIVDAPYTFDAHKAMKMLYVSSETLSSNNSSITKDGTNNNIILSIPNNNPESNFDALTYASGDLSLDLIHYKRPVNVQFVDVEILDANFEKLYDSTMDFSLDIIVFEESPYLS